MRSAGFLFILLAGAVPAAALAQSAEERDSLGRLQGSLALIEAPGSLRERLDSLTPARDPHLRLRQGLILLRVGALERRRDPYDAAGNTFFDAGGAEHGWVWPWYGIGLAQLGLSSLDATVTPARFHTEGTAYAEDAGLSFRQALRIDPRFVPAADGLADAVERNRRWGLQTVANDAFRLSATRGATESGRVLLVRARLERIVGERDSTLPLLLRSLAAGGDSGMILLEVARERFARGQDSAGIATYWAGVDHASSEGAWRMLRRNLSLLVNPAERAAFDSLTATGRAEWIRRFWSRRELDAGATPGARLVEHFRRYEVAARGFRPPQLGLDHDTASVAAGLAQAVGAEFGVEPETGLDIKTAPDEGAPDWSRLTRDSSLQVDPKWASGEFDSRGIVYLRHGPPDDRAGGYWLYRRPGGDLMVRVNESAPGGPCNLMPKYCRFHAPPELARRWERETDSMTAIALRTDSWVRPFLRQLDLALRFYALPAPAGGQGLILTAFAIPADELVPDTLSNGLLYQFRVRTIAGLTSGRTQVDQDTTRRFLVTRPLSKGEYLQGYQLLAVPPGDYQVRLTIENLDGTRGTTLGKDSVPVGAADRAFTVSDLLLAPTDAGLVWSTPAARVPLDPLGAFSRSQQLSLYYQVAGLPPEGRYTTIVEVLPAGRPNARPSLRISFDEEAPNPVTEVARTVDVERLREGRYILQVTVVPWGGTPIRRRTYFELGP